MPDRATGDYKKQIKLNPVGGGKILPTQRPKQMKKFLFFASALAGLFLASSCQRESLEPEAVGVTYTINLPEVAQTKGNSGYTEYDLYYEVYKTVDATELETADILFEKTVEMTGNTTTLTLDLLNDQSYTILFWANKKGVTKDVFGRDDLRKVEIKSSLSNNNDRDAFYGMDQLVNYDGAVSRTVTLTRPFAQLNVATLVSKTAGYDMTPLKSYVKVTNVPTQFNVLTSEASGDGEVVFDWAEVPTGKKVDKYDLVAMNYVLVPESNVEVYYQIKTENGTVNNTVSNVPLKPNYRTNIVGNLLTSNATYTVDIKPGFDTSDEVVELWDGETTVRPAYDDQTKTWTVTNGSELAWIAQAVNGTLPLTDDPAVKSQAATAKPYNFAGEIIKLSDHINLDSREWTPIGVGGNRFSGTFDGDGHTIYNLRITARHGGKEQAALFGNLAGTVVIKNLTIDGAEVVYPGEDDFYGAALVATAYGNVTIDNVTVKDSYISGNNKVAGILAHDGVVSSLNINNCHVLGCTLESLNEADGGNVGGLVGLLQAGIEHSIKNSSVKNTIINGINSSNTGKRANGEFVACVYGKDALTVKIENCVVAENTFTQNEGVTYVSPYGVFVGGRREEGGMPTVIVDGTVMIDEGLVKEDDTYYVATATALLKAVDLVSEGETVALTADIDATDGILLTDKNFTIDLGGNTYTVAEGANTNNRNFKIAGSSVVTIQNGTMVAAGDYSSGAYGTVRTEGTAQVTLKNLKLYNYRGNGLNVKALSGTKVIISETEIYSQYGGGIESAGGTIELTDVKVEQKGMYTAPYNSMAISVNGGGTVTVNSGIYTTECITAEEANNQGTSHGPWVVGVLNSGGTLIINGGTFTNSNYGDDALAIHARGAVLADTGANVQINGGTFDALKNVIDIQNNLGDASKNPKVILAGGNFSSDPRTYEGLISVAEGYVVAAPETEDGYYTIKEYRPAAKVGNTEYGSIDEAIANWTNNTTLTLLDDVTLSDVVTIKSTEHHILNLDTYTLTAASGKNAIEITCNGRTSASYALTINADATHPGGITASGKACIYYNKSGTTKDRPIILINNGVFTGSYSINSTSNGNTNCPQVWINGGVFNSYMNLTKNMLRVSGGIFHAKIYCTGDQNAYRLISGGCFCPQGWQFMTADASNKFAVSSVMSKDGSGNWIGTYDIGVYVNKEGYLVVGGPVITESPGDNYEKKSYSSWSSYLKYSSAATYGLYYEK